MSTKKVPIGKAFFLTDNDWKDWMPPPFYQALLMQFFLWHSNKASQ